MSTTIEKEDSMHFEKEFSNIFIFSNVIVGHTIITN